MLSYEKMSFKFEVKINLKKKLNYFFIYLKIVYKVMQLYRFICLFNFSSCFIILVKGNSIKINIELFSLLVYLYRVFINLFLIIIILKIKIEDNVFVF